MKLSLKVRNIFVKRFSDALREKASLYDFNDLYILLDRWNTAFKVVPYGIFSDEYSMSNLDKTNAGVLFRKWLDYETGGIEKDFNKSRKIIRSIKSKVDDYKDSLAFNLSANNLLQTSITALFIDYNGVDSVPFSLPVVDEDSLVAALDVFREYLASVFFFDMASDSDIEKILDVLINGDLEVVLANVVEIGVLSK